MQRQLNKMLSPLFDRCLSSLTNKGVVINNHTQNSKEMQTQIDVMSRSFQFIGVNELTAPRASQRNPPFCLITFDDGKKINLDAAHTLRRNGIPAIFFVCTDFVGSKQPLWFDELAALYQARPDAIRRFDLAEPKRLPFCEIRGRLDRALEHHGIDVDLSDPKIAPMTWDDVRELASQGFAIGAHGRSHAILTNEDPQDAAKEIRESLAKVELELGVKCSCFAFANGNYTGHLANAAQDAGARLLFTTEPVWLSPRKIKGRIIPRIQLHDRQRPQHIQAKLLAARLGFVLKDPNGTGRQYVLH